MHGGGPPISRAAGGSGFKRGGRVGKQTTLGVQFFSRDCNGRGRNDIFNSRWGDFSTIGEFFYGDYYAESATGGKQLRRSTEKIAISHQTSKKPQLLQYSNKSTKLHECDWCYRFFYKIRNNSILTKL